jgi:thiosulfate/3-mercaptopyruvate sulfurtransferase
MQKRVGSLLLTALIIGCGSTESRPEAQDAEIRAAPSAAGGIGLDLFVEQPAADAQLVVVGEAGMNELADRHGAVFLPFSTFSVERDGIPNEFPPATTLAASLEAAGVRGDRIVIVGEPIPAGRAWAAFDYLGLGDRAVLLDGGPAALPATPPTPRPERAGARLEVDVDDDMIVDAEWVHARLDDRDVVIIDARPPAEFSGDTPGDGIERPGHIPGARNLFWQRLVHSADDPRLKDEAELRRLFEDAGVGAGTTIVAYCRTGGQSSFLYTVARHLGYDVRLYDGSFVDWSRTDYPVER